MKQLRNKLTLGIVYGIGGWISMSLLAYGLALRGLSDWKQTDFYKGEVRQGRITWIDQATSLGEVTRFKIDAFPLMFLLPTEFVLQDNVREGLSTHLRAGSVVFLKTTQEGVVLEMAANPSTPANRQIASWESSTTKYPAFIDSRQQTGSRFLFLGLLAALVPVGAHLFLRRRRLALELA